MLGHLRALSLQLNPCPSSSNLFDCGIAVSGWSSGALWSPRSRGGGFRWVGGCAEDCTQSTKPSTDSGWGELVRFASVFPRQSEVVDELRARRTGCRRRSPARSNGRPVRGFAARCRPSQCPFGEAEGVFDVEPAKVGRQHRSRSGSPSPDHHSHRVFLICPAGLGRCSTSTRITLPLTIGGSLQSRQRPRPCSLGCSLCHAADLHFAVAADGGVSSASGASRSLRPRA